MINFNYINTSYADSVTLICVECEKEFMAICNKSYKNWSIMLSFSIELSFCFHKSVF